MSAPTIHVTGLVRRFGPTMAVNGVSFTVERGEIFGLLGHNGAGKTTTLRLLNGILRPTSGEVRVFGLDPTADGAAVRRRTGVLTVDPGIEDRLTVRENLVIHGRMFGVDRLHNRVADLVHDLGLDDIADVPGADLSSGMRQRTALARSLLHRPRLLLLDEPTARMDPVAARSVRRLVQSLAREQGRTVVLSTHNLAEAQELCDRIAILRDGRLVAVGSPGELAMRAGTDRRVRLTIGGGSNGDAAAAVASVPGVVHVETEGVALVATHDRDDAVPDMVRALIAAGVDVFGVQPISVSLEDVYVAAHGRQILGSR